MFEEHPRSWSIELSGAIALVDVDCPDHFTFLYSVVDEWQDDLSIWSYWFVGAEQRTWQEWEYITQFHATCYAVEVVDRGRKRKVAAITCRPLPCLLL